MNNTCRLIESFPKLIQQAAGMIHPASTWTHLRASITDELSISNKFQWCPFLPFPLSSPFSHFLNQRSARNGGYIRIMHDDQRKIPDVETNFPKNDPQGSAYYSVLEDASVMKPIVRSYNVQKKRRQLFSINYIAGTQSNRQVIPEQKVFWDIVAGSLQKCEPLKVLYALLYLLE